MSGWYLGNLPSIQSDPNSLLTTFGSSSDILGSAATTIDAEYSDSYLNDNTPGETMTYDVGAGSVTNLMEIAHTYAATIVLVDDTVIDFQMVVVQATDGETFALHARDSELDQLETTQIRSVTFDAVNANDIQVGAWWHSESIAPACFCRGTRIMTPAGERLVETLSVGDMVTTLQHGPQPLLWVGVQRIDFAQCAVKHMPIEFKPGSLGADLPRRTLAVSPQHRFLVAADGGLALGPAKGFIQLPKVRQRKSTKRCDYYALLLPRHEVIFAEGVQVESFLPGSIGLSQFSKLERLRIQKVLWGGTPDRRQITPALPLLSRRETAETLQHSGPILAPSRHMA